jgi:recombination protein RecA
MSKAGDPQWLKEIRKKFGQNVIKSGSELQHYGYRGSGSIALDVALGGGWGRRKTVQLRGKEGSGKTLLFDMAAIEAQRKENLPSLVFDFEGTHDATRFIALGGDPSMLLVVDHQSVNKAMLFAEDAFDMCKIIFANDATFACILFDSTGAMLSTHEYDKKMDAGQEAYTPFHTAKAMSDGLKILNGTMSKCTSEPTVFYVSQGRDNIGGATFKGMPPQDKHTGGRALGFYASQVVDVSKGDVFRGDVEDDATGRDEKNVEVGHKTRVKVNKNKLNRFQKRVAEFDIYTEGEISGLDRIGELVQLAIYTRVFIAAGSWFDLDPEYNTVDLSLDRIQGKEKLKDVIKRPEVYAVVEEATRTRLARMMDISKSAEPEEVHEDTTSD